MQLVKYGELNKNNRIYERGSVKFPKHDLPVVLQSDDLLEGISLSKQIGHSTGHPTVSDDGAFAKLHVFANHTKMVADLLDSGCCFVPALRDAVVECVDGVDIVRSASVCGYFLTAQPSFPVYRKEDGHFAIQTQPEDFDAA